MNIYETVERLGWVVEYEGKSIYLLRPIHRVVCVEHIDSLVTDGWEIVSGTGHEVVVKKRNDDNRIWN